MKKTIIITGIILSFAVSSFAGFDFSLWTGFTTVGMKKINDLYIDIVSNTTHDTFITAYGITPTTSVNHIGSGYLLGVEASYSLLPFISIEIRTGYLNAGGSFKL